MKNIITKTNQNNYKLSCLAEPNGKGVKASSNFLSVERFNSKIPGRFLSESRDGKSLLL